MKTAISVPDEVFRQADQVAQKLGWSRSQLYTRALSEYLSRQGEDPVTEALNAVADELSGEAVPVTGRALVDAGLWEW